MKKHIANLELWQLFVEVARYRSYRSAAAALQIDPSSVSRRIASLETALGVKLFDTSGQHLQLTEAGRSVWRGITPLLSIAEKTLLDIEKGIERAPRQLHILASAGFQNAFLWRAVAQFRELHPEVSFWIESFRQGDSFFDQLGFGVDIIVTSFFQENPKLYIRKVSDHAKVAVASPGLVRRSGGLRHPADLARVPLAANVHFLRNLDFRNDKTGESAEAGSSWTILSDNSTSLADWAAAGHGAFIGCPSTIASELIHAGRLQRICPGWSLPVLQGFAYASYEAARDPNSLILTFLDFLTSRTGAAIENARGFLEEREAASV